MSEHHYHFKSPNEIRTELGQESQSNKSRQRILWIVLLDLLVLSIVMSFLYFAGFLGNTTYKLQKPLSWSNLQISGSTTLESEKIILFLHVENISNHQITFPKIDQKPIKIKVLKNDNKFLTAIFHTSERIIRAGETSIYREELPLSNTKNIQLIEIQFDSIGQKLLQFKK